MGIWKYLQIFTSHISKMELMTKLTSHGTIPDIVSWRVIYSPNVCTT